VKCEIISSTIVFQEFLKVEKSTLRWEQFSGDMGPACVRYVVRRGDSVGIVPVCMKSGTVVLVKQFRFPARRDGESGYLWEIPAGMVDGDEEVAHTAVRELFEEIGIRIRPPQVEYLTSYYLSPGLLDEKMHLFLAPLENCMELKSKGGNPAEHEDLLIRGFSRDELFSMIADGKILDAKSISGLLYYFSVYV
jgi:nudix-type nucleoside diphosphatase (YffH/AdpP family)